MTPCEKILERLAGVQYRAEGWRALCPAHDDRHPTLYINEGREGQVLLKCFAGCDADSIVSALGLELRDLFTPKTANLPQVPRSLRRSRLLEIARMLREDAQLLAAHPTSEDATLARDRIRGVIDELET